MQTDQLKKEYYKALLKKDSSYEGVFFVGVKTTGVFCRPTCPARKPHFKNCEFFKTAEQALLSSYRPCQRCQPLLHPDASSDLIKSLIKAVEENPEKKWKSYDFQKLGIDVSTARRQFKKRFGMTFVEYARARRMGIAMKQIREGKSIIDAQLSTGYESGSGFRDAFSRTMGAAPSKMDKKQVLKACWIDTKLGPMIAISSKEALYLLEFVNRRALETEIMRLREKTNSVIIPGTTAPIKLIEKELKDYFEGKLKDFKTPIALLGSPFQKSVWQTLQKIPFGKTISYKALAKIMGRPNAYRAVASANGANQLALIIPCHRVININGELGGYGGGLARKKWLIEHEAKK